MVALSQISIAENVTIPQLGLGVWQVSDEEAADAVSTAIECGYRSIDTAAIYKNERGTGEGLERAGLGRDEIFVTTKLWNDRHGDARAALAESLERLGLDHVDLYLIHWPVPRNDNYVEAWRTLVQLRDEGLARAVGVSNFTEEHLQRVIDETGVIPALTRSNCIPICSSRICATSWSITASPPRRGARSVRARACSMIHCSGGSRKSMAGRRPRSCFVGICNSAMS